MGLSTSLQYIHSLPPAYEQVQELAQLANSLEQEAIKEDLAYQTSGSTDFHDASPESLRRNFLLEELPQQAYVLFMEIFEREVKAENFEIFQVENFFGFITHPKISPLFLRVMNGSEKIFLATIEELKYHKEDFASFVDMNRENWSASQVEILWTTFKENLDLNIPDWVSVDKIAAKDSTPAQTDSFYSDQSLIRSGLRVFFGCFKASPKVIEEATALTAWGTCLTVLTYRMEHYNRSYFANEIGYDFPPLIVRDMHPEYLKRRMKEQGVDSKVVNMLILSWRDDLDSLLDAAKSLSAEPEPA